MVRSIESTLRESFIFGDFPAEEIGRLTQICSTRKVKRGEGIFAGGDQGDSLFIVAQGGIRILRSGPDSYPETLAILGPGGLFGEISFIGRVPRSSTAVAMETSWILELSRSDFDVIFSKQPRFAFRVMKRLASIIATRVRSTNDKIVESVKWSREIRNRVGWRLTELADKSGNMEIAIKGQGNFNGRILQIRESESGFSILWENREGRIHWTPYHALNYLRFSEERGHRSKDEGK
jgi:CRP/FNR family cyclic AMP-dependent transcriptional regulator